MSRRSSRRRRGKSGFSKWLTIAIIAVIAGITVNNAISSNKPQDGEDVDSGEYDAVCFVTGNVANSPEPNFQNANKYIESVINATEAGESPQLCMYSATKNPYAIELDDSFKKGSNKSSVETGKKILTRKVNEAATTSPNEAGANYYEAILRAANYLNSNGAENPLIIVYGSGLSDYGTLNFAFENLLDKDINYITNKLELTNIRKNEFSNINLVWYGAGQVVKGNGQFELSTSWQNKVEDLYKEALRYTGINPSFKKLNIKGDAVSVATDYTVNPTFVPGDLKPGYKLSLNEDIARFEPNLATLKNSAEVKEMLTEFAKSFNNTSNIKLKITGYQTVCAKSKELSVNRASTIRDILVKDLNVDSAKISIDGVAGPQDNRVEEPRCGTTGIATEHRTVIIEVIGA